MLKDISEAVFLSDSRGIQNIKSHKILKSLKCNDYQ